MDLVGLKIISIWNVSAIIDHVTLSIQWTRQSMMSFFSIWVSFICFMYVSYIGHVVSFHLEQSMPSRLGLWPDWQQIHNRLLANHNWSINWLIDINKLTVFNWVVSTNLSYHHGVIATLVLHSLQVMYSS